MPVLLTDNATAIRRQRVLGFLLLEGPELFRVTAMNRPYSGNHQSAISLTITHT
jgi:hypothetical protein